jgi:glycosyltransferase involved in cell wall biosynthesis
MVVALHRTNKNIPLALKVFEELLQLEIIGKQTLLFLLGNHGTETATIRSFIKRQSLEKSIKLIGRVSDGELRWFYENCELLMAPSLTEGAGLPVVGGLLCVAGWCVPIFQSFVRLVEKPVTILTCMQSQNLM